MRQDGVHAVVALGLFAGFTRPKEPDVAMGIDNRRRHHRIFADHVRLGRVYRGERFAVPGEGGVLQHFLPCVQDSSMNRGHFRSSSHSDGLILCAGAAPVESASWWQDECDPGRARGAGMPLTHLASRRCLPDDPHRAYDGGMKRRGTIGIARTWTHWGSRP